MRKITLITTGGTIEKTYDEHTGELANRRSLVRRMLSELRLEETEVSVFELMSKDSLAHDRRGPRPHPGGRAGAPARARRGPRPGHRRAPRHGHPRPHRRVPPRQPEEPRVPIVLTGAMRPFEMKQSDALQNLTEAIFAAGALPPGVYCVAHGRVLPFPGVRKDTERGTFVKD